MVMMGNCCSSLPLRLTAPANGEDHDSGATETGQFGHDNI